MEKNSAGGGNFRLPQDAVGRKGAMLNFCEKIMGKGAGGPDSLQTSPVGEGGTVA